MKEFKVIKTTHSYSQLSHHLAYAIISTTYMTAEPDAIHGVHLDNEEDMFIIARDIAEAHVMLIKQIDEICEDDNGDSGGGVEFEYGLVADLLYN
jgi:hypothetical protein|tara:strand:+ start:1767 stop:2051 length:285 start_codon:yes stop_codon:yes gene_type:complete